MLDRMLDSTALPVLEQVVQFTQARHGVLAGNIANIDTPGYRARDLSTPAFEARLREAIVERDRGAASVSLADAASGAIAASANPVAQAGRGLEDLLYHDDSTGSLEMQATAVAKNQMQHNLAVSLLASQLRLLQAAISERA